MCVRPDKRFGSEFAECSMANTAMKGETAQILLWPDTYNFDGLAAPVVDSVFHARQPSTRPSIR